MMTGDFVKLTAKAFRTFLHTRASKERRHKVKNRWKIGMIQENVIHEVDTVTGKRRGTKREVQFQLNGLDTIPPLTYWAYPDQVIPLRLTTTLEEFKFAK